MNKSVIIRLYSYAILICVLIGILVYVFKGKDNPGPCDPGIKVEYYVEIVSEDSIIVQSVYGKIYHGTFDEFEDIILKDNL